MLINGALGLGDTVDTNPAGCVHYMCMFECARHFSHVGPLGTHEHRDKFVHMLLKRTAAACDVTIGWKLWNSASGPDQRHEHVHVHFHVQTWIGRYRDVAARASPGHGQHGQHGGKGRKMSVDGLAGTDLGRDAMEQRLRVSPHTTIDRHHSTRVD